MQIYNVTPNFGETSTRKKLMKGLSSACKKLVSTVLFSAGKVYSVKVVSTLSDTMPRPCIFLKLLLKYL